MASCNKRKIATIKELLETSWPLTAEKIAEKTGINIDKVKEILESDPQFMKKGINKWKLSEQETIITKKRELRPNGKHQIDKNTFRCIPKRPI